MDKSLPLQTTPATYIEIENRIIDTYAPQIGAHGFAVYVALLCHLSQSTEPEPPSYVTIARKLRLDQGAVRRHVKKLKTLQLISPQLRFKEDGAGTEAG
jgi:DNA-binding MarR family transcriptional regulator